MDMYGTLFSGNAALSQQAAMQIFGVAGEAGPLIVIMDADGTCRPSDSHRFAELNISESYLAELRSRIDDGQEPIVTEHGDCCIVGAQLSTERTHFGYVMVALPQYSPEAALGNIELIEMLLNQFNVIATLIEKNNRFIEAHNKVISGYMN
ncbi:MAG TPA: hypothetical protein ENN81_04640 [Phycisphaerales bacterium]|nr:hypothetical protein [Phycisphaerales bacterium]